ncbi:MAG TPA: DoxX family membrane protein [Salinimicrobium sp.]|nr:DoxX family membrane protein [Salinimicrobium sp.]
MRNLVTFLLRLALGVAFLSAVADRLGFWGTPGTAGVSWGNWENFVSYTGVLSFGAPAAIVEFLAYAATVLEVILGVMLIIGLKTKWAAVASGFLLLLFGLAMAFNLGIKAPLDYSVFSAAFAAFLLSLQPTGKWSMDYFISGK